MGIKAKVISAFGKSKFWCGAHKPEITLVVGLAAMAGCVVTTVIATKKSVEVIQDAKMDMEDIDSDGVAEFVEYQNARREAEGLEPIVAETLDPEVAKKKIKRNAEKKVLKYAIAPIACGAVSVVCQVSTYRTLNSGLVKATLAAIAAEAARRETEEFFKDYRGVVRNKIGEEAEKALYEDILPKKKVTKTEINPETGEEVTIEEMVPDEKGVPWYSIYSRVYTNQSYQPFVDVETVKSVQNIFNDRLNTRGYVFLNEVYEALHIPVDGNFVGIGWISSEFAKGKKMSDGYIDFGIFTNDLYKLDSDTIRWLNGDPTVTSVKLDFNVDGPIYKYVNAINAAMKGEQDTYIADRCAFLRARPESYHVK